MAIESLTREGDLQRNADGSLVDDDGLEAAITISLFTDARASADDGVGVDEDPRGYWGDAIEEDPSIVTGSKLWLCERLPLTDENLRKAEGWAKDATAWLVTAGVFSSIEFTATRTGAFSSDLSMTAIGPGRTSPYSPTWEIHFALQ